MPVALVLDQHAVALPEEVWVEDTDRRRDRMPDRRLGEARSPDLQTEQRLSAGAHPIAHEGHRSAEKCRARPVGDESTANQQSRSAAPLDDRVQQRDEVVKGELGRERDGGGDRGKQAERKPFPRARCDHELEPCRGGAELPAMPADAPPARSATTVKPRHVDDPLGLKPPRKRQTEDPRGRSMGESHRLVSPMPVRMSEGNQVGQVDLVRRHPMERMRDVARAGARVGHPPIGADGREGCPPPIFGERGWGSRHGDTVVSARTLRGLAREAVHGRESRNPWGGTALCDHDRGAAAMEVRQRAAERQTRAGRVRRRAGARRSSCSRGRPGTSRGRGRGSTSCRRARARACR